MSCRVDSPGDHRTATTPHEQKAEWRNTLIPFDGASCSADPFEPPRRAPQPPASPTDCASRLRLRCSSTEGLAPLVLRAIRSRRSRRPPRVESRAGAWMRLAEPTWGIPGGLKGRGGLAPRTFYPTFSLHAPVSRETTKPRAHRELSTQVLSRSWRTRARQGRSGRRHLQHHYTSNATTNRWQTVKPSEQKP